ncbi:OmpA family protein [Limnobacter humi]|uniref:OmpA family protein n=1 Tax=Limnobacter humi TaxID=1778671 RepID=A0ABT1WF03_9BURK|nr:OmpA family protein [Limnobacter humi]MCQ8895463.1 OmpA family protein [Limnobacter humi]
MVCGLDALADSAVIDLGRRVPKAADVREGLFPEDACEELKRNGFQCMGFKPAVRFSIPNAHFRLGSADLPDALRRQLDVFAEVLVTRPAGSPAIVVTGHADASGDAAFNLALSQARAKAVKDYLIGKGVSPGLLTVEGKGAQQLADVDNPFSSANRRVEIGRAP